MTALVAAPKSIGPTPIYPLGAALPSWGATKYSQVAEKRINSLRRLTGGTVFEIGSLHDTKPKSGPIADQLRDKLVSLKRIVSVVSMYLDADWRIQLLDALDRFLNVEDWEDDIALPSEQSFSTFLRTMIYFHPTKRPGLGLSTKGHFLASWSRGRDRIVIECLANDEIRWVLSQTYDGRRESGAGKNQIHRLPDVLAGYLPDRFFQHGEKLLT
jgi:hypothetical protein